MDVFFFNEHQTTDRINPHIPEKSLPVQKSMKNPEKLPSRSSVSAEKHGGKKLQSEPLSLPQTKREKPYQPIILQTAKRYQIEPALINAVIMAESSFNPDAVSHKGAKGLMQLMPRTAEYLGVKDAFNPAHNIEGGTRYLKTLLDRFDRGIELALAAYNAGSRNLRKYGGIPPFKTTKIYIKKVLSYYES